MSQIRKFSFVYDRAEDRLACDTEAADGATTRLWLTQRFCKGLVAAILPFLTRSVAAPAQEHQSLVQSWEQVAAMADFGKTPGVKPVEETVVGLVRQVHLGQAGDGLSVTFDFGVDDQRTIMMDAGAVRQTLSVLHDLHTAAGWPLDIWPGWISGTVAGSAAAGTVN